MARQKLIHLHGTGELKDASKLNLGEIAVRNAAAGTAELYILNEEGNGLVKFMDAKAVTDAIQVVSDKVGTQDVKDQLDALELSLQGEIEAAEGRAAADATSKANAAQAAAEATAAADATSKANAAKEAAIADTEDKLKSYSTTTQMNSAISEAEGRAAADAQTKANAAQAAAEATAAADATSKANAAKEAAIADTEDKLKSYSTTTQMNSAISEAETRAAGDAQTKANAAEAAAKGHADSLNTAMDERVAELEKIDHDHSNKTVLDGIDATKVANWDEAKAKIDFFLDTKEIEGTVDTLHEIAEWMNGDGVNATELSKAIADEADLRTKADAALAERIAAFEGEGAGSVKAQIEAAEGRAAADATSKANAAQAAAEATAAADATSKANAAKEAAIADTADKLKNYSTTTQMNSAISEAETRAAGDATSKANAAQAAAEATAAADATSKANAAKEAAIADTEDKLKSYSTTTQMNSAISEAEGRAAADATSKANTAESNAINAATGYTATQLQSYSTTEQMNEAIKTKVETLDANLTGTGANTGIDVTVTQVDGVITTVTVDDSSLVIDCGRYDA